MSKKSITPPDGERMIQVNVKFWTNNISKVKKGLLPKNAWSSGMVYVERNKTHGITPLKPVPFHTLTELGYVIEKALYKHGVTLHLPKRFKKHWKQ